MKLYTYDRHRRLKLALCIIMILVAVGVHFWTRTRRNLVDYQTEPWQEYMPPYVPVACLDDYPWPQATPERLQEWIAAKWVDWKLLVKIQSSLISVTDYFRHWIALSSVWTVSTPFVGVSRSRIQPLSDPWISYLSRLPERVEVVFWADANHPGFTTRPLLGKPQLPPNIVPLRSAPMDFPGMYMVRTRALRKKLFRLFPIAHSFEHTLCQVFRAFRAPPLASPESVTRPIVHTPQRWKAVPYPVLDVERHYDARSLRYWVRTPLSDVQLKEYFGHVLTCMQHHQDAEWLLVHADTHTTPPAPELQHAVDAVYTTVPTDADAVVLVGDRDQLRLTSSQGMRRLGYVERPQMVLYRTQSIRDSIHRLFPVLHPLGIALCTQWNTYGSLE